MKNEERVGRWERGARSELGYGREERGPGWEVEGRSKERDGEEGEERCEAEVKREKSFFEYSSGLGSG